MNLVSFQTAAPATAIKAADLDANFAKLKPMQPAGSPRQYSLTESPVGWSMKIFPDFPTGSGKMHVLGIQGGQLRWIPTQECE